MATKDFGITENKDLESSQKAAEKAVQTVRSDTEASKIKNAHAVGDGSYGRSDDSVSEAGEEDESGSADNNY